MEKETKLTAEQGKKENEIVELTDEDMSTITAGAGDQDSGTPKNVCGKNKTSLIFSYPGIFRGF